MRERSTGREKEPKWRERETRKRQRDAKREKGGGEEGF